MTSKRRRVVAAATEQRLVQAAMDEFARHGYDGTNTNAIARRAGFAPQTFYRWFDDKAAVFIATYEAWQAEERAVLGALLMRNASSKQLAHAIVEHHRDHLLFRRSLRQLTYESDIVRAARNRSRAHQAEDIAKRLGTTGPHVITVLLQIERLADAAAEDECRELRVVRAHLEEAIARLIDGLGTPGRR